ncbi:MAG TPA: biosynthetic arginine decarboxylase [Phycisphaerales bacterium]|nr:biosynthetic arginine decarboxylase [Phycisphaerales bacterium]
MQTKPHKPLPIEKRPPRQPDRFLDGETWSIADSRELYQIEAWRQGFFDISDAGHVVVRPNRTATNEIDIYEVVQGLHERGIQTPVIIGFTDLLARRIRDLHEAFQSAIAENNYKGRYIAVYPVKVNQQRHLVEQVQQNCQALSFGLEVGSKPELLAVLGLTAESPEMPIICNGFKESRYVEFVTLAVKLGRNIIPVIENISELELILEAAEKFGVRPRIGVRANLEAQGAGRWRYSSGAKAKFGLSISEMLEVFELLKKRNMADCFELLHCHMGSQIHDIRSVTAGVNELTRIYTELVKMGAGLKYLDVGGGLGVDYDGSQTDFEFSMNYTLGEYASNVVYRIMAICDDEGIEHPTIITECGRAMVAHHSVLVFDILGANRPDRFSVSDDLREAAANDELPRPVIDLLEAYDRVSEDTLLECYHDAVQARDEALSFFRVGHLSLPHRAVVERLYWSVCVKIRDICRKLEAIPEELMGLESNLSDTYFCNLSIFQSLPDAWAIDQIFPIMPIHRLDERPTRRGTLADITCDSDGKLERFIDPLDVKKTIELHAIVPQEKYYVAAFLVGAYQETLGDLHNLFGDTHLVHVKLDDNGRWWIDHVVEGDSIREVLSYVQYDVDRLHQQFRRECEHAVRNKQLTVSESRTLVNAYESGLAGYTYLE